MEKSSGSVLEVFCVMARLGCIAFGGPVAHLACFQKELIDRRKWLSNAEYADLIAFCQFLPGPASSQVGMGLGLIRAGVPGMFAAWAGFSGPSVIILLAAAAGLGSLHGHAQGWLHGLLAGVVAIVAEAVWKMSKKLCPSPRHLSLALLAAIAFLLLPHTWMQILIILFGALIGLILLPSPVNTCTGGSNIKLPKTTSFLGWAILLFLVLTPVIWAQFSSTVGASWPQVYAAFTQTGAMVFGGGHVVLPLLQTEVVAPGWMQDQQFLAGYGITQAMPGPIFTLSSYLGAVIGHNTDGTWISFFSIAAAALIGIFMPSFGFIAALLPLWHRMRASLRARRALQGINSAVVGLLIAALYDPVWLKATQVVSVPTSLAIILMSWILLVIWKRPAWLVLTLAAAGGALVQIVIH